MVLLSQKSASHSAPSGWIELHFLGDPAPQGSKVQTKWGGMKEVSKKIEPWRGSVQYACDKQYKGDPITDPVEMSITFILPRSKSHYRTAKGKEHELLPGAPRHHTKKPDSDKLLRGLLDPLTVTCGGNVLRDDSLIVRLFLEKRYAEIDEPSGALVRLRIVR